MNAAVPAMYQSCSQVVYSLPFVAINIGGWKITLQLIVLFRKAYI